METIVDLQAQNSILNEWRGANAKIWLFHVTHKRLALHLFRTDEHEAIYIVAVSCEKIAGPFSWKNADISIAVEQDSQGESVYHVLDRQAGFELLCSGGVVMARGPQMVPMDPFRNFIDS
jgi:hypothetical protein